MRRIVYGVGVNDADYVVTPTVNGVQVVCPFYRTWKAVLERCYSDRLQRKYPTYIGCSVCKEWLIFSNFRSWMVQQDWEGKHLDKDILVQGNKIYSPDTCVFVTASVNNLTIGRDAKRGKHLIGACFCNRTLKFIAHCNDGNGNLIHLGYYDNEFDAHLAWKACKHKVACRIADEQSDIRVAEALRTRYL